MSNDNAVDSKKKVIYPDRHGENGSFYGKKHTEETKKKMRDNSPDVSGENNPFYGKHHSEESKKKMGGAVKDYTGENGPFYGKHHSEETKEYFSKLFTGKQMGKDNPFYGKTHTKETLDSANLAREKFREDNKDLILERQLKRLDFSFDKLNKVFAEYRDGPYNMDDIQELLGVDKRVFAKYVVLLGVATEEDFKKVSIIKRMQNSHSSQEEKLYKLLCLGYGKENVIRSYKINSYFYDFFVNKSLLVEYDGYYWHQILVSKNDIKKTELASGLGIELYRVREPESRKTDFDREMVIINEVMNEVQAKKDRVN